MTNELSTNTCSTKYYTSLWKLLIDFSDFIVIIMFLFKPLTICILFSMFSNTKPIVSEISTCLGDRMGCFHWPQQNWTKKVTSHVSCCNYSSCATSLFQWLYSCHCMWLTQVQVVNSRTMYSAWHQNNVSSWTDKKIHEEIKKKSKRSNVNSLSQSSDCQVRGEYTAYVKSTNSLLQANLEDRIKEMGSLSWGLFDENIRLGLNLSVSESIMSNLTWSCIIWTLPSVICRHDSWSWY